MYKSISKNKDFFITLILLFIFTGLIVFTCLSYDESTSGLYEDIDNVDKYELTNNNNTDTLGDGCASTSGNTNGNENGNNSLNFNSNDECNINTNTNTNTNSNTNSNSSNTNGKL
jgi:hypothetical protein